MKKQEKKKKINKINQKMKLKKLNKLRKSSLFEQSLTMQSSNSVEDDNLLKYVQWHILQKKKRRKMFMTAYIKLNAQDYDLQTLQFWKNKSEVHWKNMHIQFDIDIQLTRDVSKYDIWRLQRFLHVKSTTRTMSVSQSQIKTQNQT